MHLPDVDQKLRLEPGASSLIHDYDILAALTGILIIQK
ncbi:hypothetical protein OMCYN_00011 [cyanobiont of Ornithocercus magnificus]|nr:hypothetical protein OMCYN_00011 [cyanobiont of Ornithocercus magnificus]